VQLNTLDGPETGHAIPPRILKLKGGLNLDNRASTFFGILMFTDISTTFLKQVTIHAAGKKKQRLL
jgi:hypothetical protein